MANHFANYALNTDIMQTQLPNQYDNIYIQHDRVPEIDTVKFWHTLRVPKT